METKSIACKPPHCLVASGLWHAPFEHVNPHVVLLKAGLACVLQVEAIVSPKTTWGQRLGRAVDTVMAEQAPLAGLDYV